MTDFQALGQQFCDFYYKTFDADRSQLAPLYTQGVASIVQKLAGLPFQRVAHKVTTLDAQPSSPSGGGVIVMVTGELLVDEENNPQRYSQVFHLMPEGGSFYVFNGNSNCLTTNDRYFQVKSWLENL